MIREDTVYKKKLTGSTVAKVIAFFLLAISFLSAGMSAIITAYMASREVYSYADTRRSVEAWAYEMMENQAQDDIYDFYFAEWPEEQEELALFLEDFCGEKNIRMEVTKEYSAKTGREPEVIVSNYDGFETSYVYDHTFYEYEQVYSEEAEPGTDDPEKDDSGEIGAVEIPVPDSIIIQIGDKKEAADSDEIDTGTEETLSVAQTDGTQVTIAVDETQTETDVKVENVIEPVMQEVWYHVTGYVSPDFYVYDEYSAQYERAISLWELRFVFPMVTLAGVILFMACFVFLMCSAGHRNDKNGIQPGVLYPIHFDVLTAVAVLAAIMIGIFGVELVHYLDDWAGLAGLVLAGCVEVVWCTLYFMEAAVRLKLGKWWKNTLIYQIFRLIGKLFRGIWGICVSLVRGLPLIAKTVFLLCGISFAEMFLLAIWGSEDFLILWILEKIVLFPIVIYIALSCKKLQEGSAALADGNLAYKLDTSKMILDFKEHGDNLNRIGQGISKAVEERMKSEHLKTELITNVSHDIKTPLTSIINYADLLGTAAGKEEGLDRETVAEYSEVLLRQSKRMKKLLEDLVEASKATTGNLEVKMERCEVSVLLSQAVGEYEQRLLEKDFELITRQPEEPVWIMADGRRLWRVFDNLLNNICKYAQEHTRVYVTVARKNEEVEIIFRNMSQYPLDLTGEELEERFVRGDKSRHMEGNGLGLSIAKSLVDLQNGKMEIVTDGDLFKVILRFPVL